MRIVNMKEDPVYFTLNQSEYLKFHEEANLLAALVDIKADKKKINFLKLKFLQLDKDGFGSLKESIL
jgi:hypothetical protein